MLKLAETFLLVFSVCLSRSVTPEEHHTRHSLQKYLTPCPASCQCVINDHYAETVDITCQNRSGVGIKLPHSVTSLHFYNVSTPFIQSSNLVPTSGDSEMVEVVYKRSGIKVLSEPTFSKLSFLESLDLSENLIKEVPETVFQPLVHLRVLILSDNKFSFLPDNLLTTQQHLTKLYLSKNSLELTHLKSYSNCKLLQTLDLSYNKITKLQAEPSFNPTLVVLLLNNNKLQEIPANAFEGLKMLQTLNLSNNEIHFISEDLFRRLIKLNHLDIYGNDLAKVPKYAFEGLTNLQVLNISKNPITSLDVELFRTNLDLNTLVISDTHISSINAGLLTKLRRLKVFKASHNYHLRKVDDFVLSSSNHLQFIDFSFGNLTVLPTFISHLEMVEQLKLEGNMWQCDCKSGWLVKWLNNHQHLINSITQSLFCDEKEIMIDKLTALSCEPPQAANETIHEVLEFRSTVVLTCEFSGEPTPSITWVTPSGYVFHYYPNNNSTDIDLKHPRVHLYNLEPVIESRVNILSNGSLQIQDLLRQDAGLYTCVATNSIGKANSHIVVTLDLKTFLHIKIMCIIVGASSVAAVLVCTALGQLIYWICKKCGIIEERSKQLMQLRENIETYKTQQLQSLRENYTQQVHRIKQNCALQVEWIRESYQGQVKHIRDFKHYGSHQFSSIRDQYYDQMKKVRDYSTTQLGWVRENYVYQRNRIQKFSSHQVLRFRESYKYQQNTLNKILQNLPSLNLDNCRGSSGGRSESSIFVEAKEDADAEVQGLDTRAKSMVEEMTDPSVLEDRLDEQSIYYTPSELSESPLSPKKEFFIRQPYQFNLCPDIDPLNCPGPSHWPDQPSLQDSPCRVFSGSQCPITTDQFFVHRTLQSSTSLPEMPQLNPSTSHETAL